MKKTLHLLASASLAVGLALPVWAEVDVPSMTCGDFAAMDAAGKTAAANALIRWAQSTENASQCGTIPLQLGCGTGAMNDSGGVHSLIEARCQGEAVTANVIEELKAGAD